LSTLSEVKLRKIAKLWLGLGVASAILGIVQHYVPIYHPLELPDVGLRGYYHSTGMTGWHLSYASIIGFPTALCLAVVAILYRREKFSRRTQIALGATVLFFIAEYFYILKNHMGIDAAYDSAHCDHRIQGLASLSYHCIDRVIFHLLGYFS